MKINEKRKWSAMRLRECWRLAATSKFKRAISVTAKISNTTVKAKK